ncbi:MAG TPA: metallophosphoesterase [Candidatus Acidoferrales bacterium]|nr:metallophosphoesterase [Candidatus Acidoferrales bacterium]
MKSKSFSKLLRTKPISPHPAAVTPHPQKPFGKSKRPLGNPVAPPKQYPRFVPPPPTNLNNLNLPLDVILPDEAKAAQDSQLLIFHCVGDTGGIHGDDVEKAIGDAMDHQISAATAAHQTAPAFFYNLGDVVYFNGESQLYGSQFYEPYQGYHASIFAIAGNHDGDTHVRPGDPVDTEPSLFGFMRNFCDTMSHHDSPYRPTMTQPYVYWTFETPFATIVGLYSDVDGTLDARGTSEQLQWFQQQVASAPSDRSLIVAVHHPPYSLDTTHGGYPDIGIALDRVIQATGRTPTAVLSGHVHSYQRFERTLGTRKVPYIVAGAGGYANKPALLHQVETTAAGASLPPGFQTSLPDVKLMAHNDQQPGFLRVTLDAKKKKLTCEYFLVPFPTVPPAPAPANPVDTVTVPW